MVAYMFENDVVSIFDATRDIIALNSVGQPVDHIGTLVTITTANVFPNYEASPLKAITQL